MVHSGEFLYPGGTGRSTVAIDELKIDETVLALLHLTLHDGCRAWKNHDWNSLNRLHEKGVIEDPVSKAKSVVLTQNGLAESERMFKALFVKSDSQTDLCDRATQPDPRELAREAKALVALAFRNGPIEDVHAGKTCPACDGKPGYSRISDAEMQLIRKAAVNRIHTLLQLKANDPDGYERQITYGERCARAWDDPQ
jgi:hypothetical protein